MDIRIGNDIKLTLTLIGSTDFNLANVKQLQCYLINTTLDDVIGDCDKSCSIKKRFPREPFPQFYTPTAHTLHTCGKPEYFVHPAPSKCEYAHFGKFFHDYHAWPGYRGFGVRPGKFSADPGYVMPLLPSHKHYCDDNMFLAPHKIAEGANQIEVYFPACDLRMCGSYKLVVVMTVYESGWGRTNLHTYTIDKGDVFTLVDDSEGISGDVTINVDTNTIGNRRVIDILPVLPTVTMRPVSSLHIGKTDASGNKYQLLVTLEDGSKVLFNPKNWHYDALSFISSDPSVLDVNSEGLLVCGNATEDKTVTVTVVNPSILQVMAKFDVLIKAPAAGYVGFSTATTAEDLNLADLAEVDDVFGNHTVTNKETGKYLWIVTTSKVSDVNSSLFDVPLAPVETKTERGVTNGLQYFVELNCYHCPNALIATTFDISVEEDLS